MVVMNKDEKLRFEQRQKAVAKLFIAIKLISLAKGDIIPDDPLHKEFEQLDKASNAIVDVIRDLI